jgi:DNA repair protein RecO (recombination protein O)
MTYKTKAIVLKSKTWPRNARLYTLYSERFGKIKGVAAGTQKVTSKIAGHLQPFTLVEVMMAQGKNIDRLAQGCLMKDFSALSQDYQSYIQGSYVLEIIDTLTQEGVADYLLWDSILELMEEMNQRTNWGADGASPELLIRLFAFQLLDRFGYRPELYQCLECRKDLYPENLAFSVAQGGTICGACRQKTRHPYQAVPVEFIKLLRQAVDGSLTEVSRIVLHPEIHLLAVDLIDQMVMMQTQKPLRTVNFFEVINQEESIAFF